MVNKSIAAVKYTAGKPQATAEVVTREEALQIKINGKAYTITMRTPGQDELLTLGLLFTEGLLHSPEDVLSVTQTPAAVGDHTLMVDVAVKEGRIKGKNIGNRSIASSASCGVCGKIDLCDLVMPEQPVSLSGKLDICLVPELVHQMNTRQSLFEQTGGSHAAAIFSLGGTLLSLQEDIGRHNAVDKAIGELFVQHKLAEAAILFVSGRVSYEIVAKCAQAGIPFLLAVSAPSSLAVEFCEKKGITLLGFCRDNRATVYTHHTNILQRTTINEQPHEATYQ